MDIDIHGTRTDAVNHTTGHFVFGRPIDTEASRVGVIFLKWIGALE